MRFFAFGVRILFQRRTLECEKPVVFRVSAEINFLVGEQNSKKMEININPLLNLDKLLDLAVASIATQ